MNKFVHIELDEKKFAHQTLNYILNNQNTCLGSSLFIRILDPRIKYGDLNNHIEFLKERLSHIEFFVDYNTVEYKNKMDTYQVLETDNLGRIFDNSRILTPLKFEKENFSKEIFWANAKEEEAYQKTCHFKSFEDKIINEKKFYTALENSPFFNVKAWILYYQDLLNVKFPEFSNKIVSGKSITKYRPFKGEYFLGIETDYQSCRNNFKRGWWEEPEYKLVIFKMLDEKTLDKVVIFDKFVHPHFNPPVFSFAGFFGSKTVHDVDEVEFVIDDGTRKEILEDSMIRLYNSEEFGDELKRHAYFYYDMLYHTTKEFIKFVEESFDPEEDE
ncbi:hypothetical protein [Chryseobacterium polytrichastri]|uniref:Uncharacterized protein n=1 Tax=Chryseobacterium polytrichastri TaxID=1302687 RepID=A0A1M7KHJ9_9FLAO|nr:hypothetical protein [Chryseobacterium polytrichastri]SHM64584.1 hypothetical protein SAMN05444267_10625 [Chryseobacterium polytrichastri]